jgi:hypothetical protein
LLIMCGMDFTFIGTRNAPTFVLLFLLLAVRTQNRWTPLLIGAGLFAAFAGIFNYSTVSRSGDTYLGIFSWVTVFEWTNPAQVLKPDMDLITKLDREQPALLPVIFLFHYVSHSIAELVYFLENQRSLFDGGLEHLRDQVCVLGFCSRTETLAALEAINPRGIYATWWRALIADFGIVGAVVVYVLTLAIAAVAIVTRWKTSSSIAIMLGVLIALSSIENYAYNGLGLASILATFVLQYLLCISRPRVPASALPARQAAV